MDESTTELLIIMIIIVVAIVSSIPSKEERERRKKQKENDKNYKERMQKFHGTENNNNNRHSYMYQDVEQEIIKVDHTFSKEVFLNNAKELFFEYHNAMVKGNCEKLKQYSTGNFFSILQNKIEENKLNNINVVAENIYIYNAFLYEFSKTTDTQVITVKLKTEMKTYEINNETQIITKGNKYAKLDFDYEMQFERKTKGITCQNCGASVNIKDLSKCEYCGSVIELEDDEWKLNYINILKD